MVVHSWLIVRHLKGFSMCEKRGPPKEAWETREHAGLNLNGGRGNKGTLDHFRDEKLRTSLEVISG